MRSVAVIGLGRFGNTVARELSNHGAKVIAIDERKERVEEVKDFVSYAVVLSSTDKSALKSIAIQDVDAAVVCIGEDVEANLLTTLLLKKIGVKKIWARAIDPLQSEILQTLEVDHIINLEEEMGKSVALSLVSGKMIRSIPLTPGHSIAEIKVPLSFVGKTLLEIEPRKRYSINVVAIKSMVPVIDDFGERGFQEKIDELPSPELRLAEDDILLVAGSDKNIDEFSKM